MPRIASIKKPMSKPPTEAPDENELLRRVVKGDTAAFERLYLIYHSKLQRFILRMTNRVDGVDELIQDTMMVVWEKAENFDYTCKPSTWIFGIAYRKALKSLAKNGRYDFMEDTDEMSEILADTRPTQAMELELVDWLGSALTLLSPDQRAVLELTFHHGLHYKEIADILDCPENTVKTRMFHARKKLQHLAAELKKG